MNMVSKQKALDLFQQKRFAESFEHWLNVQPVTILTSDELYSAALAARNSSEYQQADAWLTLAQKRFPSETRFYLDWAKIAMNQERWKLAKARFKQIPEPLLSEDCYHFYAISCFRDDNVIGAAEILTAGLSKFTESQKLALDLLELAQLTDSRVSRSTLIGAIRNDSLATLVDCLYTSPEPDNATILHLVHPDSFTPEFIKFVAENLSADEHYFLMLSRKNNHNWPLLKQLRVLPEVFITANERFQFIEEKLQQFDKVIVHSLFNPLVVKVLDANSAQLYKCYWMLWGSDLYNQCENNGLCPSPYEKAQINVMTNIGAVVCQNSKHVNVLKKRFGYQGNFIKTFKYPSNMCVAESDISAREFAFLKNDSIKILVGNSVSRYNNFDYIFNILAKFKDDNIQVVCPLSYGDPERIAKVRQTGCELFGEYFVPLEQTYSYADYCALLQKMDAAMFDHTFDQGMGTIRQLLSMAKPVYVNASHGAIPLMAEIEVTVNVLDNFTLEFDFQQLAKNKAMMQENYSKAALVNGLQRLFAHQSGLD